MRLWDVILTEGHWLAGVTESTMTNRGHCCCVQYEVELSVVRDAQRLRMRQQEIE